MESTLVKKWLNQFKEKQPVFNHLFLFFVSFAFALSDWMYGGFTFTELILGIVLGVLFIAGKYRIHAHQFKWLIAPVLIISLHTIYLFNSNDDFVLRVSAIALIKLSYYLLVVIGIYNYIKVQKLEQKFMVWNNLIVFVVLMLGVYIALAVYMETNYEQGLPYESLLRFTRLDGHLYRRDIPIVRMKSIFQEPAHLGYYLNSILMVNLLSKQHLKMKKWMNSIIIVGVVLTLSYSSVFILLAILMLWLLTNFNQYKADFKWTPSIIISSSIILITLFLFREMIYTTIIQRTIEIVTGAETSGFERLIVSWRYINKESYLLGYGFLQSPGMLWNNFAYVFTELGLIVFILFVLSIGYLAKINLAIALVFVLMNFAKGGYLSSSYWFLILLVMIYSAHYYEPLHVFKRKEEHSEK